MTSITSATTSSTAATTATSTTTSTSDSSSTSSTTTDLASTDVSSIDWDAIIEASYQAKLAKADTLETKITANEAKIAAYEEAQTLLSTLMDTAQALRAPTGTIDSADDVFLSRTAYLTAVGSVDTDSTVSVTADDGAATGSFDLTISQLAKAHKVASSTFTSSSDDLGLSGDFSLGIEGGDSVTITVDSSMSLADIASAINETSDDTGVQASVLKVSSTEYELILSSVETGETIVVADDDGVLADLGVVDDAAAWSDELQAAQDAIFTIDGVTITRSTNDVDDAIDGVTLHLYSTTEDDASITVEVGENLSDIKDAIIAFVDAYNAYREWALTQQETATGGGASDDAVLFGDGTIRGINIDVAAALNFSLDDSSLRTLGISFDENNYLVYDEDTLDDQLLADVDSIEALFAYSFSSSSSDLRLLARGTGAPTTFTLDITVDADGDISGVSVDGDDSLFTWDGARIKGATGTIYEGYTFVFTGDTSQTVTITQTTGIAEQLYNVTEAAANTSDGSLETLMETLTEQDDDYQEQIDDIESRATTFKENLTARYAKIQAAISEAQSTLDYLEALLAAQNSD
jgi:flagellar hook-associated protein 2